MADYKNITSKVRNSCLECGSAFSSASRPDKKFCCDQCKNAYNNKRRVNRERFKVKVDRMLLKNYTILDNLAKQNIDRLPLNDLLSLGFNCNFMTSSLRSGNVVTYSCYDITYRISDSKIWGIRRMSLNLQDKGK